MVFKSRTQYRKYAFRAGVVALGIFICLTLLHITLTLTRSVEKTVAFEAQSIEAVKASNQIILTFDDGPHPAHTREIVKILKEYDVPATFFFLGSNMLYHRDVVREVYDEDFLIGNHSFTHSRNVHASSERIIRELNTANELIEDITGHGTVLYRPPFLLDLKESEDGIVQYSNAPNDALRSVTEHGFIVIDSTIDSKDWETNDTRGIIEHTLAEADAGGILLFHDGGGITRQPTVEALPVIIQGLRDRGYEFVSLATVLGAEKDDLMPPTAATSIVRTSSNLFIGFLASMSTIFPGFITLMLVLSIFRILMILFLFFSSSHSRPTTHWRHGVSVLIPAYNEGANVEATIQSVLQNTYPYQQIIIVNDGSTDDTKERVEKIIKKRKGDITLISVPNGGKAKALNIGLQYAKHEVIVAIDGDTIVDRHAVENLSQHFVDPTVGAVAGKVYAVAHKKILGFFQAIEYITSQNIDKLAFNRVGAVGVVPGAIGAWRKSVVLESGGYHNDTLVEDQDLTLAVHTAGYRVVYDLDATAYTEVPYSTSQFIKQRYRWTFGTIQCMWKHRKSFFSIEHFPLGWIILPYNLLFQVMLPLTAILIDGIFISSFFIDTWEPLINSIIMFILFDMLYSTIAFTREGKSWYLLAFIPVQRIYYHFVLTYVIIRSIISVIEGTSVYWNKLDRKGSAQQLFEYNMQGYDIKTS